MPGICGLWSPEATAALGIAPMLDLMRHHEWHRAESHAFTGGAIGCVALDGAPSICRLDADGAGRCVAVLVGSIHDAAERRRLLEDQGSRFAGTGHAELLLRGFLAEGGGFLRRLNASFSAALWHERAGRLLVVNDRFGLRPLYYAQTLHRFAFASSIKALLTQPGISPALSEAGVAQFFAFHQMLGDGTLLGAVRALPPASLLNYVVATGALRLERYWDPLDLFAESRAGPAPDTCERIGAAFDAAVGRCIRGAGGLGLSLSGGLDSRTLLAAVPHSQPLTCVTMGMPGSFDRAVAACLAHRAGRPIHHSVLDERFLSAFEEHLRRMVRLTDGHYVSACVVVPSLDLYRALGIRVLLRGHGGELMHIDKAYAFSADRTALGLTGDALGSWLYRRITRSLRSEPGRKLLTARYQRSVEALARDAFDACFGLSAGIEPPAHRISHLFLTQHVRRATGLSMAKFESVTEIRLPYIDADLITALMAAPPFAKHGDTIHAALLHRYVPNFLTVPNANTGAPVGAGLLRRSATHGMCRVLAKLGFDGYQPYERIGLWLRRHWQPAARRILLSEACLDRGVLDAGMVRRTLAEHAEGRANHSHVIMAMLAFEAGQQELHDEAPLPGCARPASRADTTPAIHV